MILNSEKIVLSSPCRRGIAMLERDCQMKVTDRLSGWCLQGGSQNVLSKSLHLVWLCVASALLTFPPAGFGVAGELSEAALGMKTYHSWTESPGFFDKQLKKRQLPLTSVKGMFVYGFRAVHAEELLINDMIVRIGNTSIYDDKSCDKALHGMRVSADTKITVKRVIDGEWRLHSIVVKPLERKHIDKLDNQLAEEASRIKAEKWKKTEFRLPDGEVLTGEAIDKWNRVQEDRIDREGLTSLQRARFIDVFAELRDGFRKGDDRQIRTTWREWLKTGKGRECVKTAQTLVEKSSTGEQIITCEDGRAYYVRDVWRECARLYNDSGYSLARDQVGASER